MEGERQDEAPALERGEQVLTDQMCHAQCPCEAGSWAAPAVHVCAGTGMEHSITGLLWGCLLYSWLLLCEGGP